jgi:SHS2 domain-containing protein
MKPFDIIDISGDAGIKAYGKSLEDAFVNVAIGMYSLITDLNGIHEQRDITVEIEKPSVDSLLVSWLNELIFQFDTYGFTGKKVTITEITPSLTLPHQGGGKVEGQMYMLKAIVSGEDFDPERHERKLLIKAATYHQLKIEEIGGTWKIDVIFDI